MKPKRVRLGRKPAMDSRLAISVGFALGCDLSLSEVAEIAGVSEATIVR
jgi:transcription initiation factor TFIIIB Brf1 subunit/transcription initiation factor TFIIB